MAVGGGLGGVVGGGRGLIFLARTNFGIYQCMTEYSKRQNRCGKEE